MSECTLCDGTGIIEAMEAEEECYCSLLASSWGAGPPCGVCSDSPEIMLYDCHCGAEKQKYISPFTGKIT